MKCHLSWIAVYFLVVHAYGEKYSNSSQIYNDDGLIKKVKSVKQYISILRDADIEYEKEKAIHHKKYSAWTKWSDCDENSCTRIRKRICSLKRKCGRTVQSEEKRCRFFKRNSKKIKCRRKRRKADVQDHNLQTDLKKRQRKYRFKIIKTKSEVLEKKIFPSKVSKWYSEWSRWSSCNRHCITHRKRWCKKPKYCIQATITETAYCYLEGTFCQRYLSEKIKLSRNNANGELLVDTIVEELPNRDRNEVEVSSFVQQLISHSKCGVAKNMYHKKSAWSMTRIIGGRQAPKGKWPWQVAILNKYKEAFCGGTLIAPRWILTAAHCIRKRLYVRLGEHSLTYRDDTETEVRVIQTIVHPSYDPETVDNDVALLRLPTLPKHVESLQVACLPNIRQQLPMKRLCTIIGWGKRRSNDSFGSDTLHEAEVPIVTTGSCRHTYIDYYISTNMFCAGYKKGRMDTCAGDSGGPLLCKDLSKLNEPWTIFGITSFGDGCGKKGKYGIYTKVPNYVRWINKVLRLNDYHIR